MRRWQPWLVLLCAALTLALAPAAAAQQGMGGMRIQLDPQTAGSRTLSGKVVNVPSDVKSVAVTLKLKDNSEQVQIADSSSDYKFSFSDVTSWQSLSARPISASPSQSGLQAMMYPSGSSSDQTGYGYGYGGYPGYGAAYAYGYPGGFWAGYYLPAYYRFYQPDPNWQYLPYAAYGLSPYSPYAYAYGGPWYGYSYGNLPYGYFGYGVPVYYGYGTVYSQWIYRLAPGELNSRR